MFKCHISFYYNSVGKTDTMKQYRLGKVIKPHESELPKNVTDLLYDKHYTQYLQAYRGMSEKQKKVIEDGVKTLN